MKKYKIKNCKSDVCDFCVWYDFNGENGCYVGKGYCNKLKKQKDPEENCKEFICKRCNPKLAKKIRQEIENGKR